MSMFSRVLLSGSVSGQPIPVAATATPGTVIHTAADGESSFDEVYLFAANVTAVAAKLTIEWGGVANPGSHLVKQYNLTPFCAPIRIADGQVLNGGTVCRAFSDTASAINITGFVTRISQ